MSKITSIPSQKHLSVPLDMGRFNLTAEDVVTVIDEVKKSLLRRFMAKGGLLAERTKDVRVIDDINTVRASIQSLAKQLFETGVPIGQYFEQPVDGRTKKTLAQEQQRILENMRSTEANVFISDYCIKPGDEARNGLLSLVNASAELLKLHVKAARRAQRLGAKPAGKKNSL